MGCGWHRGRAPSRDAGNLAPPRPHDPLWISRASRVMSLQAAWHRLEFVDGPRPERLRPARGQPQARREPGLHGLFLVEWYRQRGTTDPARSSLIFFKHLRRRPAGLRAMAPTRRRPRGAGRARC